MGFESRIPSLTLAKSHRSAALQALAAKWPDKTTRALLAQRAVEAPDASERGVAYSALGKMHSEFGRILPTRDLEGFDLNRYLGDVDLYPYIDDFGLYLDPLQPIPREHIERAAKQAGIRPQDIDATVAALSAHLGWDLTGGAKPSG